MLQLRTLQHLVVLSRRLSYARAAEDLGISQSALSRSIQSLERQLGMRLFDRDRSGVSLTPEGQLVVERAGVLLADADEIEHQFLQSAHGKAGRIRFGMAPMPARALLSAVLAERLRIAPDVTNEVVVRDVTALWSQLVSGEIEFFVSQSGLIPDSAQARIEPLGHFPLSLIVRPGHPLLRGDAVPEATFPVMRSSWVGVPLPPEVQTRVRGDANVIEDYGALATITAATEAIWFSSSYAVTEELKTGALCELPRPDGAPRQDVRIVMYTLARRSQSALAKSFKQAFRHRIRALAQTDQQLHPDGLLQAMAAIKA
jgi:DNA-binding transcriptional LysR family regulator